MKKKKNWVETVVEKNFLEIAQGAEESCLTVMLAQFIAQIDLVIHKNERD